MRHTPDCLLAASTRSSNGHFSFTVQMGWVESCPLAPSLLLPRFPPPPSWETVLVAPSHRPHLVFSFGHFCPHLEGWSFNLCWPPAACSLSTLGLHQWFPRLLRIRHNPKTHFGALRDLPRPLPSPEVIRLASLGQLQHPNSAAKPFPLQGCPRPLSLLFPLWNILPPEPWIQMTPERDRVSKTTPAPVVFSTALMAIEVTSIQVCTAGLSYKVDWRRAGPCLQEEGPQPRPTRTLKVSQHPHTPHGH